MKDLLDYYERVDAEAAAVQLAVLEEVTYVNVMKTGAEQTIASGKRAVDWISGKLGVGTELSKQKVLTTAERITARSQHWKGHSKSAIDQALFSLVSKRLGIERNNVAFMSSRIIEEAAAGYAVSEDLLPSQQALAIAKKYMEDCQEGLREKLRSQSAEQVQETERILKETLARLTANEKLEIQKALELDTLSASSVRDVVLKSGIPFAGIAAVQAGGFGGYLALTTVMHAVFTSMLGITLPFAAYTTATSALSVLTGPFGIMFSLSLGMFGYFWGKRKIERSQYAMLVSTCVGHATEALVPPTNTLPSAQAYNLLSDGQSRVDTVFTPQSEKTDFFALEEITREREAAEDSASSSTSLREKALLNVDSLERSLKSTQEIIASFTITQTAESGVRSSLEKMVYDQQQKLRRLENELTTAKEAYTQALSREAAEKKKALAAAAKQEERIERRCKELKALWQIRYSRIVFDSSPLRWAAKQDFQDRIEIERALAELHDAKDPVALSRNRMHATHEHHSGFTLKNGTPCRIFYSVRDGCINISRMCKKKDA